MSSRNMTFKQFITEKTATNLSPQQFIEWCEMNATEYLKKCRSQNIYFRGMEPTGLPMVKDTNELKRFSANTHNYYTIWIDGNPAWKNYPKRSKSYICSTSMDTAACYGEAMVIIPADNCHVGVCPTTDMWFSFKFLEELVPIMIDMESFMNITNDLFEAAGVDTDAAEENYDSLVSSLKSINIKFIVEHQQSNVSKKFSWYLDGVKTAISNVGGDNLYDVWVKGLDPEANKFSHFAGFPKVPLGREVWVQGNIAAIQASKLLRDPQYRDFMKKYFNERDLRG